MALRVETVMMGPDTDQYAGKGQGLTGLSAIAEAAKRLEQVGFDGITAPEAGHDPFMPLAVAAEHTKKVRLGTNVAVAFPRSPMVTAQIAWDLQNYSGGRFNLGLGSQVKGHNERRYSTAWPSPPGPRMREYVLCLRAIFDSFQNPDKPRYFEGEHYQFTMLPPFFNPGPIDHAPAEGASVPIYLAAVNPYMAGLSGELCEGLRLHPIATFAYARDALQPAVAKGVEKSGRNLADFDLLGAPFLATGPDQQAVEKAKNNLRQQISFYASTRSYHSVLAHHGWEDVGLELHGLAGQGKWTDMPALITDDMLGEWAVIASYENLAKEIKRVSAGLFDTVLINMPQDAYEDDQWLRELIEELHC